MRLACAQLPPPIWSFQLPFPEGMGVRRWQGVLLMHGNDLQLRSGDDGGGGEGVGARARGHVQGTNR
jgi:hypothetical protein